MNVALMRAWYSEHARWERIALVVWAIVLMAVSVRVIMAPEAKTVYPIFSASGVFWLQGIDLYEPHRPHDAPTGYRYSPVCSLLFVPFALLPDSLGGAAWRLFSAGAFLAALGWFARSVLPTQFNTKYYAWLILVALPLSLQSINNGQANLIVAAAMLAAIAATREGRWNLACSLLAFGFACKLYPIALGMVLMVLYPKQLGWRLPLTLIGAFILPFACQHPNYVLRQYFDWIGVLLAEDRTTDAREDMYRDLWLLFYLYGVPVSRMVYHALQFVAGVWVAVVCWRAQKSGWSETKLLTTATALTVAWMMLLGPATESSSFALLAPVLAWSVVERCIAGGIRVIDWLLWVSCLFFAIAILAGGFSFSVRIHAYGVHSWASLAYFSYLLVESRWPVPTVSLPMNLPMRTA